MIPVHPEGPCCSVLVYSFGQVAERGGSEGLNSQSHTRPRVNNMHVARSMYVLGTGSMHGNSIMKGRPLRHLFDFLIHILHIHF